MEDEDPPSSAYLPSTQVHYANEVLVHTYKSRDAPAHIYSPTTQEDYIKGRQEYRMHGEKNQLYMYLSSLPPFFIENKVREVERRLLSYLSNPLFTKKRNKIRKKKKRR